MEDENILVDYIRNSMKKELPKDPFAHAASLIDPNLSDKDFRDLLSKQIFLANIDDDKLLRLYQNDATFLVTFFGMASKSKGMRIFFRQTWTAWNIELAMTRAKKGLERQLQNFSGVVPKSVEGFGRFLRLIKQQQREDRFINELQEGFE